jgi:regulator of cell morphogenesis and NO signaling
MQELSNKTIREIALESPLTTRVFEEFKIDFCCGGRVPFNEACEKAGVDPAAVQAKLDAVIENKNNGSTEAEKLRKSPTEMIEYIISTHHVFTRSEIARLLPLSDKVASRHGENHPELLLIQEIFRDLAEGLLIHMQKEEAVLFPYIEQIDAAASGRLPVPLSHFGSVQNPVRMMMFEHDRDGATLKKLRKLSSNYTAPADACPSFKGLYAGLEDFERDLHRHIHLENNVLFPQAVDMETVMLQVQAA